jgi:hypothetical protein
MVWNKVRILIFIVLILLFSASNLHYINVFNEKKENHMHLYNTIKDVSYKLNVFNNDFIINQYTEMDKTYIADLIDNIDINFLYEHLEIENESEINYMYDVSAITYIDYSGPIAGKDANLWKQFLIDPEVSKWVSEEINLIRQSEIKKMIKDVSKSNSVGQAQLMNALAKMEETSNTKEGPIFIYTYVPLSPEQKKADNVVELTNDIFLKEK